MQIDNSFRGTESFETFLAWWQERIGTAKERNLPGMPDFFEVWNARQSTIDALKKENEQLKNKIAGLEANK
jgi:hypothetical protein